MIICFLIILSTILFLSIQHSYYSTIASTLSSPPAILSFGVGESLSASIHIQPNVSDVLDLGIYEELSATINFSHLVENTIDLVKSLQQQNVKVLAIEQAEEATMLGAFSPETNTKYAVVFGNEVKGVTQEVVTASNTVIEIPQFGTKHSLNISVSAGVVLWDLFNKVTS